MEVMEMRQRVNELAKKYDTRNLYHRVSNFGGTLFVDFYTKNINFKEAYEALHSLAKELEEKGIGYRHQVFEYDQMLTIDMFE